MLKTLDITNFTCFPEAKLEFSPGLNVIVGENGTGKSHLLKLGYAAWYVVSQTEPDDRENAKVERLYSTIKGVFKIESPLNLYSFLSSTSQNCSANVLLDDGEICFSMNFPRLHIQKQVANFFDEDLLPHEDHINTFFDDISIAISSKTLNPTFIPAKEILSIYPGLAYEIENKLLAFDDTYLHIAKSLSAPELRGPALEAVKSHFVQIEKTINSICTKSGDKFYLTPFKIENVSGKNRITEFPRLEAHIAAEGHRKIALLSYLIKNGTLQNGSSLFWDEPEANLNPKLLKSLAAILVELSSIMQITIATHSLFLVRELEIAQEKKQLKKARYFGLHFNEDGNGVSVTQGDSPNHIGDIVALDEEIAQSSRYLSANAENLDDSM